MITKFGTGQLLPDPDAPAHKTASAFSEDDWADLLAEDEQPQED